jgi:hypothetical protein
MNKIVRFHYPVDNLPEELRPSGPAGAKVTVIVTLDREKTPPLSKDAAMALIAQMQGENRGRGVSREEAVARIRELRDEWET